MVIYGAVVLHVLLGGDVVSQWFGDDWNDWSLNWMFNWFALMSFAASINMSHPIELLTLVPVR